MNHCEEQRDSMRLDVRCTIYCKLLGTEESHKALCITLSGSGISFTYQHPFEIGTEVAVTILPETTLIAPLDFFITIVRCQPVANDNFEIGAQIIFASPDEKTE